MRQQGLSIEFSFLSRFEAAADPWRRYWYLHRFASRWVIKIPWKIGFWREGRKGRKGVISVHRSDLSDCAWFLPMSFAMPTLNLQSENWLLWASIMLAQHFMPSQKDRGRKKHEKQQGSRTCKTTQTEQSPLSATRRNDTADEVARPPLWDGSQQQSKHSNARARGFNASLMTHVLELKFSERLLLYRLAIPNPSCIW